MKKRNIISALALTMTIGIGATAYAASISDNTNITSPNQRLGLGRITSMRGYDYTSTILKDKLGLTDEEITTARNSGKTIYDLALEKGISQEEIKSALLEEKAKAIDAAVTKGTITKEEGDALKANLSTNIENCTGNFGQMQVQGKGKGQGMMRNGSGRGMMGNGQGRFNQGACSNLNVE
jgi:ribosomal protein S20